MAIEYVVPRVKQPVADLEVPPNLQSSLKLFLHARPMNEILFEYLKQSGISSVRDFIREFEGLLKCGAFSNADELKREYMGLGKDYAELKKLIEWIDSESTKISDTPTQLPGLMPEEQAIVAKHGVFQKIKRGTRLIRQGSSGSKIFFLLAGAVDLFRKTESGSREHICQIGPGHVLGEYGAFLDLPRTADVITTRDCDIFVLDIEKLKDVHVQAGPVFEVLKERVFLFKNLRSETGLEPLPFPIIRKFFDDGEIQTVSNNHVLFSEGDWGDSVYFILDGEVHVIKGDAIKRTMKRGDYFGEIALLKKTRRTAKTQTACPSTLLKIDHLHFLRVISQNISLALQIEKTVSERLKRFS